MLSDAEEQRLFKALKKADRRHTIPVFIAALETGARWSSLVEFLKWKHVDFKAEEVTITTYKDKNMKQWKISVSTRLKAELLKLKLQRKSDDPDERLFASASVNLQRFDNLHVIGRGMNSRLNWIHLYASLTAVVHMRKAVHIVSVALRD